MFASIGGIFGDGRFNGTMQNVVVPTLVAMATKIGQIWATFSQKNSNRFFFFVSRWNRAIFLVVGSP